MARVISASLRLEVPEIVMLCSLPVSISRARTITIPLASMSKVTSIFGTPAHARLMPRSVKVPSSLLSRANSRSPCRTLISTVFWNGAAVVNTLLNRVGIVEFRSIKCVATPPTVSIERVSGVTSISSRPSPGPVRATPPRRPACTAAPSATHSSGFSERDGSSPVIRMTLACTAGMRVEPPTSNT